MIPNKWIQLCQLNPQVILKRQVNSLGSISMLDDCSLLLIACSIQSEFLKPWNLVLISIHWFPKIAWTGNSMTLLFSIFLELIVLLQTTKRKEEKKQKTSDGSNYPLHILAHKLHPPQLVAVAQGLPSPCSPDQPPTLPEPGWPAILETAFLVNQPGWDRWPTCELP